MLLPKQAISQGIADIASSVYDHLGDYTEGVTFERDQLTLLSLAAAEQTAQTLFDRLGLHGFDLAWKLAMSLERIHTLGEAYNHLWFEGGGYTNSPRHDYASAVVEDEGYLLIYTPLGITQASDGRQRIMLFINGRGIAYANIVSEYRCGEVAYTPDKLITPEEAVVNLYQEASNSRTGVKVDTIERVALTYAAIRAENKQEGVVFTPVWQVRFREPGKEYTSWAEFNALNAAMIDAIFR